MIVTIAKLLAAVVLAAALAASVDAHGMMLKPTPFQITDKYRADCYVGLKGAGTQELNYAPVENLLERKQNQPYGAGFDVMNGCRGMVADAATPVTELTAGREFTVEFIVQAPHPGTLVLSIVKPTTGTNGTVMYERMVEIKKIDNFATNNNDKSTTATIPTTVTGCDKAGDCALQFYWHSDIAKQTYPTCASIIVKGGAAGGGGTGAAPAPAAGGGSAGTTQSPASAPAPAAPAPARVRVSARAPARAP